MSTDGNHSDHDLKAYLDGRDGVSAAYRKTATEEPPRVLDQAILEAARKRAQSPAGAAPAAKRRTYALAASVMIGVLAVSLYFNALDEVAVPTIPEEVAFRTVELQSAERADESDTDEELSAAAANNQAGAAAQPEFETRELAPPVPTVGVADSVAAPAAPRAEANSDAFARAAEPAPVVIDGPLLEALEADANEAQQTARQELASESGLRPRQPQTEAQREQGGELEEIMVTGARIMRRDRGDVSYRDSREDWIEEIATMNAEFEARSRLATARAAAARLEQQLDEEIELYLEAYPDADIEAELEALEE